jgi:transcriptional regulator with XRE-family HTH domain
VCADSKNLLYICLNNIGIMTDEELGANIKRVRDMKGKSQLDLANAIKSSQKHISRIEKGQTSATFALIGKICEAPKLISKPF